MRLKTKFLASICAACALTSLACGLACNSHELSPFSSSIKANKTETITSGSTRQVDILFVVDNSNSMIEEQRGLDENFSKFLDKLSVYGADFHLAAVSTEDKYSSSTSVDFNKTPGAQFNTVNISDCNSYFSNHENRGWLASTDFKKDGNTLDVDGVKNIFRCMGLTGTDGSAVERGLASSLKALQSNSAVNKGFLRDGALLAVVYVTDENDCSSSEVARLNNQDDENETAKCETNRNIEDSCVLANKDKISNGKISPNKGPMFEYNGVSKTLRAWCVEANQEALKAFASEYANDAYADYISCPASGCSNKLTSRKDIYDGFIDVVAAKNQAYYIGQQPSLADEPEDVKRAKINELARQDIIVATVINRDQGKRYNSENFPENWCGSAGTQSYRYQLFSEMFDDPIYSPICCKELVTADNESICDQVKVSKGDNADFGPTLAAIGTRIGKAINTICMSAKPVSCDPVACQPGEDGEISSACPCISGCNESVVYLKGTDEEYHVCNEFSVKVGTAPYQGTNPDYDHIEYWNDDDFSMNMDSNYCFNRTGSPMQLTLNRSANSDALVIQYPQKVSIEK